MFSEGSILSLYINHFYSLWVILVNIVMTRRQSRANCVFYLFKVIKRCLIWSMWLYLSELQFIPQYNKLFFLVLNSELGEMLFYWKEFFIVFLSALAFLLNKLKLRLKNNETHREQFKCKISLLSHYTFVAFCCWIIHYIVVIYKIIS